MTSIPIFIKGIKLSYNGEENDPTTVFEKYKSSELHHDYKFLIVNRAYEGQEIENYGIYIAWDEWTENKTEVTISQSSKNELISLLTNELIIDKLTIRKIKDIVSKKLHELSLLSESIQIHLDHFDTDRKYYEIDI